MYQHLEQCVTVLRSKLVLQSLRDDRSWTTRSENSIVSLFFSLDYLADKRARAKYLIASRLNLIPGSWAGETSVDYL